MRSIGIFLTTLVLSFCAALPGVFFKPGAWYESLVKPAWTPPNWAFPIAWTLLYILMGLAAWRAWTSRGFRAAAPALAVFAVQLVLNAAWSWIFFGLHRPLAALLELALLWSAILVALLLFMRLSRIAGWLMGPYLLWVTYAGFLNAALWRLN